MGLPVFFFIFIFHHGEVGLIAALGDVVVFEGLEDGTAGFVGVGAVGETAVFRETEDLGEVAGEFLGGHVEGAEAFDTRSVYCPSLGKLGNRAQRDHFTEGGGVLTEVMGIGDLCRTQVGMGHKAVDEGGFSHAAVATEQRDLPFEQGTQVFDAITRGGRDLFAGIADCLVELHHHLLVVQLVGVKAVGLVEDQDHRDAIGLSGGQEAVDEGCGGLGVVDRDHQEGLVDVGGDDVALFGEVLRTTDNIVLSVFNFRNEGAPRQARGPCDGDSVSYRDGVGGADAFEAEGSFDFTINQLAIVRQDGVPAASVFYD